jgi:hypothetical protein
VIETGTSREMTITEKGSITLMIEVVACLPLKTLIMIKDLLCQGTSLLKYKKEKSTRLSQSIDHNQAITNNKVRKLY